MIVGLTGGVGSGKSTVAGLLAEHGALIIDADRIAREVVEPGQAAYAAVVERFGAGVVLEDGHLDRPALAAIVFHDEDARADLNAIVHPAVAARSTELMATVPAGGIVVYDVPLLAESPGRYSFDAIVVVEADAELRVTRLEGRGMPREDAVARMAAQATDEQRRAIADEIITNDGTFSELQDQVDAVWQRLLARQAS